jgi:dihydrofolate synthase/folylpolyglutamate synthase
LSARAPAGGTRSLGEWLAYQQHTHSQAIDLSLERVRAVAARLDLLSPRGPVVIIGGTNGKGSTATMLAALLRACGQRVGLFTSPHLLHYNERVQIDGVAVADDTLVSAFERIEAARGEISLTFFEYNTLAALDAFARADVDARVLEVGLGGRLDATNIIDAQVAVLCSVGFDHREWLGDTLEQIGAEKAGIFRRGGRVVLGSPEMPASVWRAALALGCEVLAARRDFDWRIDAAADAGGSWEYRGAGCVLEALPEPALPGAIQYQNAASALTALQLLPVAGVCDAPRLAAALQAVQLAGRLQIVPGEVEWILDVAHNAPAAKVLADELALRGGARRTLAVAGLLADKDAAAVTLALDAHIDLWMLASVTDEPRGLSASALQARLPPLRGDIELAASVSMACARARAIAQPGDRIVVLGSFHVVGPALSWLGLA